jgi:dihydrofolate synthase/folylpolyglutamate synthase
MPAPSRHALIGAGANLGDRRRTLSEAIAKLRHHPGITSLATSPVYETDPVGVTDQPPFLNLVLGVTTTLTPEELLAVLQTRENEAGRVRTVRWGPRTLDLDLLAFAGEVRTTPQLMLPHPRMIERNFVTAPLRDLLAREPELAAAWAELRRQLESLPAPGPEVRRSHDAGFDASNDPTTGFLLQLKRRGVRPGLERIEQFAAALGNPQHAVPCIHIAGTNGKGSVAAMLATVLRSAGWRTGLYTSPHLVRLGERIQVDGEAMTSAQLAEHVAALRPIVDRLDATPIGGPGYFEFMTGVAWRHFAAEHCDIAVIETGMGGRLDATNLVVPEVSVITSIGIDHAEFLGNTVEKIATEKAGIMKPGRPVVIGLLPPAAEAVIRATAAARRSRFTSVRDTFGPALARFPATNLAGEHQRTNAATATLAAQALPARWRLAPTGIAAALMNVTWPGRWQRLGVGGRNVILDAAHNEEGAAALDRSLHDLVASEGRRPVVVVGVLGANRARPVLAVVARHAAEIHLVVPRQSRACSHEELASLLPPDVSVPVHRSTVADLFPQQGCHAGAPGGTVVVTGSLYLVGEVLSRLEPARGPLEDHLQDF